jgi:hypothetical protein
MALYRSKKGYQTIEINGVIICQYELDRSNGVVALNILNTFDDLEDEIVALIARINKIEVSGTKFLNI